MAVASPDAILKALAAVICLAVGLVSLSGRRQGWGGALALFLVLIAINQAGEAVRAATASEVTKVVSFRIASIAASFDPAVLAWLVTGLVGVRSRRVRSALIAAGLASAAHALFAGWFLFPDDDRFYLSLAIFTAIVYVALVFRVARAVLDQTTPTGTWLLAALALVSIPAASRTVDPFFELWTLTFIQWGLSPSPMTLMIPAFLVAFLVTFLLLRRARHASPVLRRALIGAVAGAAALIIAARSMLIVLWFDPTDTPLVETLETVGRAEASVRWLGFGILASAALLRANELDFTLAQRRRAARVVISLALLSGLIIFLVGFSGATGRSISPFDLLLLAIVAAVSQGARKLIDATAMQLYGIPVPGDPIAAQETYRRAAAEVVARGGSPSRDPSLQRVREELGIDMGSAAVIERLAEESTLIPIRPGQLIASRYHVERMLGRGGAGRVFLADDVRIQRRVVLKEVFVDPFSESSLREARLAGGLQDPRVATVFDVIPRGDSMILVQEYVSGGSLSDLLRDGQLEPAEARLLFRRIVEGAAAVHGAGIAHGDLKPDNILLTPTGEPKLADFGIARHSHGTTVAMENVLVGTPEYLAPERMRGAPGSARADVYSLGLIGRRLLGPDPPKGWEQVIVRALAVEAADRWADAGAMFSSLPQDQ